MCIRDRYKSLRSDGDVAAYFTKCLERKDKHRDGCRHRGITFYGLVITLHGGIGPDEVVVWVDRMFADSTAKERAVASGTGSLTARRKQLFFATIQAITARGCAEVLDASTSALCDRPPRGSIEAGANEDAGMCVALAGADTTLVTEHRDARGEA